MDTKDLKEGRVYKLTQKTDVGVGLHKRRFIDAGNTIRFSREDRMLPKVYYLFEVVKSSPGAVDSGVTVHLTEEALKNLQPVE